MMMVVMMMMMMMMVMMIVMMMMMIMMSDDDNDDDDDDDGYLIYVAEMSVVTKYISHKDLFILESVTYCLIELKYRPGMRFQHQM